MVKKKAVIIDNEPSSQKLFKHLYEACNILRGPLNQDEFKNYIIPILFMKRCSDVYDEEMEESLVETEGDVDIAKEPEYHKFVIPDGAHWEDIRNTSENVGKKILDAMMAIERANPKTLSGMFSSFDEADWSNKEILNDERLKDLVEHMSKIKVGNKNYSDDVMGDAYEFLIKKFADMSKKNAGEFYTPRPIVKLMVKLLDPKPGDTVYDPACGTGGMLIEAKKYIGDRRMTYGKLYGQENNLSTSAIARMNLFLHGANDFSIRKGDTLRTPLFLEGGAVKTFKCVLANPPFSLDNWGASGFVKDAYGRNLWGCPSDSCGDYAWLQHMVKSMDEADGRCAVVLPQGVLFRNQERDIRTKLVKSDKLEAVITLIGGVFYSTGVSACILLLNNNKTDAHKGKVLMVDGSKCYVPMRAQKIVSEENVNELFGLYNGYADIVDKSKLVTINEIEAENFELSVNKYIERPVKIGKNYEQVRKEYFETLEALREAEHEMKALLVAGGYVHG